MRGRGDTVAALVLFAVFAAYGIGAQQIDVFPGQEAEPFKPNTMPFALAILGMLLAGLRILATLRRPAGDTVAEPIGWSGFDWPRTAALCVVMLGYGLALTPLGFVLATTLFLTAGFMILGERRPAIALLVPVLFALAFYGLMTRLLGLYLAPGYWWPGG